jgi:cobalamin biosynthesis protein CobD/CbiB
MSFFAILFALLIEQARPLARTNPIHAGLRAWALSVSRNFDAGKPHHGWVAWGLAVLVPRRWSPSAIHWLLMLLLGWPFAVLWSVAVLYVTLGFRQFSHHFTGIRDALEEGDEDRARERLAHWQQVDVGALPRSEIVRHVIEYSVLAAHRMCLVCWPGFLCWLHWAWGLVVRCCTGWPNLSRATGITGSARAHNLPASRCSKPRCGPGPSSTGCLRA